MVTGSPWLHLEGDTSVRWSARPHPIVLCRAIAPGVVVGVVGVAVALLGAGYWGPLTGVGTVLSALGLGLATLGALTWNATRYVVTDMEIYRKEGLISRRVTQVRLGRIQHTRTGQSVTGRLLGYGDVTVYTAGSGEPELVLETVTDPHEVSAEITTGVDLSTTATTTLEGNGFA